jgi:O-antigen polymerase
MRLVAGIILWFVLLQFDLSTKERLSILLLVFVSAVIESIIGVMQFFGLYRYIPITPAPDVGMVGGAFQQKNLFSSWIATGLIISLYFIITNRFKAYSKKIKTIFFICVALLSLNLIVAGSRAGLLGTALAMVIMLPMREKHYSAARRNLIIWLMVFFMGMAGGFYLLSIKDRLGIKKLTTKQIEWFSDVQQTSYTERILMYKTSLEMFKEKPSFGQGFANFGSLYMYHQAKAKRDNQQYKDVGGNYTSHPHNELFLIIAESGIAGILGFLILAYGFVKIIPKYGNERYGLYIALLSPLIIHILVEYPLQLSTAHYLLFVILIYMATSHFLKIIQLNTHATSDTKGHENVIPAPDYDIRGQAPAGIQRKKDWIPHQVRNDGEKGIFGTKLSSFGIKAAIFLISAIYIVFTAYTLMTFNAYNGLVRWYLDYTETGKGSDKDMLPATKNLYLRNWSVPMYMFAKSEEAAKDVEKNKDFLDYFLRWSSVEKRRLPVAAAFYHDANVLLSMGIHHRRHAYFDEAMRTVEEGLSLYPNSEDLKKLRPKIVSEAFKAIFDGFQRTTEKDSP